MVLLHVGEALAGQEQMKLSLKPTARTLGVAVTGTGTDIFFLWLHPWRMEVSRPGVESDCSCSMPDPLSHCVGPWIEPRPLQ